MTRYIFGPVPSRRLGISLGVDVIPFKTCTLDCIYCECGKTNHLTAERKNFVEPGAVLKELKQILPGHPRLDYITFSGSGEPTLHSEIGTMIEQIKSITSVPVAVLTNGTLLYREEVRQALRKADLVLPSLDAVSEPVMKQINQPHPGIDLGAVTRGLIDFRKEYPGQIWLEVFIVNGINDNKDELENLHRAIKQIRPERVQLNSLDRPPAYEDVQSVDTHRLEQILDEWSDLPVEIIKRVRQRTEITEFCKNLENSILNTINRRPLMIEDLEQMTGKRRVEIFKYIDILEKEKKITAKIVEDKIFYTTTRNVFNETKKKRRMPRLRLRKDSSLQKGDLQP